MIISSSSTFNGTKFWEDSAFKATDTVMRLSDGVQRTMSRERMAKRFKNIRLEVWEPEKLTKKKKPTKRTTSRRGYGNTEKNYNITGLK